VSLSDKIQAAAAGAAALSAIGTLLTIGFVFFQMRLLRAQVRSADTAVRTGTYQGIVQQTLDLDRMYVDHPDLKGALFVDEATAAKLDKNMQARVESLAEMVVDFADSVYRQATIVRFPSPVDPWPGWARYFGFLYEHSFVLRSWLAVHGGWYAAGLIDMFETGTVKTADS
jgi:hypothetical protein